MKSHSFTSDFYTLLTTLVSNLSCKYLQVDQELLDAPLVLLLWVIFLQYVAEAHVFAQSEDPVPEQGHSFCPLQYLHVSLWCLHTSNELPLSTKSPG